MPREKRPLARVVRARASAAARRAEPRPVLDPIRQAVINCPDERSKVMGAQLKLVAVGKNSRELHLAQTQAAVLAMQLIHIQEGE